MKNYYVVQTEYDVIAIEVKSPKYGVKWVLVDTADLETMPEGKISVTNNHGFYAQYSGC